MSTSEPNLRCQNCDAWVRADKAVWNQGRTKHYCSRSCREVWSRKYEGELKRRLRAAGFQAFPWELAIALWMLIGLLAYAVWPNPVWAHDPYTNLKQPDNGYSCCNSVGDNPEGDCAPSRAYIDPETGLWKAYDVKDGKWYLVPKNKVLNMKSWDGRTHYCGVNGKTYCLIVGDTLF